MSYDSLQAHLRIDPLRLTEEVVELPQYQQEASEGAAAAQLTRDDAKDTLAHVTAEAADALRNRGTGDKQPSEATINSKVQLNRDVQQAQAELRAAEYDLALWQAMASAFRAKMTSIRIIADLIQAGYTTPTSLYSDRRTNLAKHRRAVGETFK